MNLANEVIARARKFGGRNLQQEKFLSFICAKMPAAQVVTALLAVFAHSADEAINFDEQEFAGFLLRQTDYPCAVPLHEILSSVLESWNVSVPELPRYLARQFGRDAVLECMRRCATQAQSERANRNLAGFEFWLKQSAE